MQLTRLCLGRFVPWNYTPGAIWGGKQRKVPRLTHTRKSAFLGHMLLSEQNHRFLQNPCITAEVEAATLEDERVLTSLVGMIDKVADQGSRIALDNCWMVDTGLAVASQFEDDATHRRELEHEDQVFYDRYATQFHNRFVSRRIEETWKRIARRGRFDI